MATITKGQIQRQDQDSYDGTLATTRTDATGGTLTGLKVGDTVDVLSVFGGGLTANQTRSTIATATAGLSGTNIALQFAPGTWTIDDDLTIASNFTVVVPAGCVFSVAAGKTLTIAGILDRHHETYTAGSGTVTVSGTDLMAATENTRDYALDTGAANTYTIAVTPSVTSYVAGRQFRFKSANASTGASTLNVDSLGAKSIVQADGSTALSANDIVADQIVTVNYDGVDDEFHMVPTSQAVANPARTDTDNVYTKTQTWKQGADVASATALPVDVDGNLFDVTGTTTVTSIKTKGIGTIIVLQFDGILTLTHHATNLILPLSANITTAAGDTAVLYEYSAGSWRLVSFTSLTGKGSDIASASDLDVQIAGTTFDVTGTTQIDTIKTKGIGSLVTLQFDGALVLAHDATNLDLLGEANITTAAGDVAVFWEYASADWRMVSYGRADGTSIARSSGSIVQVVNVMDGAVETGTTVMVWDDTIPQNTEGDEYMTLAVTPGNASNNLKIEVVMIGTHSVDGRFHIALFQDSTADAIAAATSDFRTTATSGTVAFTHFMAAGTTSATTFKVRAGAVSAGTFTQNGAAGARKFGGVNASSITITEIKA